MCEGAEDKFKQKRHGQVGSCTAIFILMKILPSSITHINRKRRAGYHRMIGDDRRSEKTEHERLTRVSSLFRHISRRGDAVSNLISEPNGSVVLLTEDVELFGSVGRLVPLPKHEQYLLKRKQSEISTTKYNDSLTWYGGGGSPATEGCLSDPSSSFRREISSEVVDFRQLPMANVARNKIPE